MFLSDDGIMLLSQNGQVLPIGRPVKHFTDTLTIVGANVAQQNNHVIFSTSDGVALVWNFLFKRWSTFTSYIASTAVSSLDGHLFFRDNSSGNIFVEDPSLNIDVLPADATSLIPLRIYSPNLSFGGLGGYMRVYRMIVVGYNLDNHILNGKIAYDMDPTWTDEQQYLADKLEPIEPSDYYGEGLGDEYKDQSYSLQMFGSRQKCTAIRVGIVDEMPVGSATVNNENYSLLGVLFVVGQKQSVRQLGWRRNVP
jgi:hypothetical protein